MTRTDEVAPGGLHTIRDVCAQLRVSRSTVYRLINAGHLHRMRVGAQVRIHPDDLTAYIDGQRAAETPEVGRRADVP